MKYFAILAFVAFASAEVHWDQSGAYRLTDDAPAVLVDAPAAAIPAIAPIPAVAPLPLAPLPAGAPVPLGYPYFYYPIDSALTLRAYTPFVYSYKQVKSGQ